MPTVTTLPKIIRFQGMHDSGPTDGGRDCSICPHCGSKGRYTFYFQCDDGHSYGAMRGCLKLFPVSPVAEAQRYLIEKQAELERKYGKTAKLNSWCQKMQEAVEDFYAGIVTEEDAVRTIWRQRQLQYAYRASKYRR